MLINERERAIELLDLLESNFGKSIWLARAKLAALHQFGHSEERREYYSSIVSDLSERPVSRALLHLSSRATESGGALAQLAKEIEQLADGSGGEFLEYLKSKFIRTNFPLIGDAANLLFFDANSSAIDLYESLISVLRSISIDQGLPSDLRQYLQLGAEQLSREIADDRLLPIVIALGGSFSSARGVVSDALDLDDLDVVQQFGLSLNGASLLSVPKRNDLDWALETISRGGGIEGEPISRGVLQNLTSHLVAVVSKSKDAYAAALSVFAITDAFGGQAWAVHLDAFVRDQLKPAAASFPTVEDRRLRVSSTRLTALHYIAGPPVNHLEREILAVDARHAAMYLATRGVPLPTWSQNIPSVPRSRLNGMIASNDYTTAESFIDELLVDASVEVARELHSLKAAVLLQLGRPLDAARAVVDGVHVRAAAPTLFPVRELTEELEAKDHWGESIDIPLVYECYLSYFDKDKITNLRFAFESFQVREGVPTPAQVIERASQYGIHRSRCYLEDVWRPEVMRQTMLYDNGTQIEQARIDVCKALIDFDPENSSAYRDELKARIRQQEIAKGTTLVEQTKVYVDMAAIKRSLKGRLDGAYSRYKAAVHISPEKSGDFKKIYELAGNLAEDQRQSVTNILSKLHVLSGAEKTDLNIQFDSIYSEVMAEFLNGEHGLNAYLSTRVRHGKLTNSLRKPLLDEALITAKLEGADGYVENNHWDGLLEAVSDEESILVKKSLMAFASQFDGVIDFVNASVIKVNLVGEDVPVEKDPAAFSYWSTNLERAYLQDVDRGLSSFDEFIDRCMDTLWEKTDENLLRLQEYLSGEIRSRIIECFEALSESIRAMENPVVHRALQDGIASARVKTLQKLVEVMGWFKRGAFYDRKDYSFDFPFQVALNIVNKTMPKYMALVDSSIVVSNPEVLLPGRTLDGMVDIFDVILSNAIEHSGLEGDCAATEVSVTNGGGRIYISATSRVNPTVVNEDSISRVGQLKVDLGRSDSKRRAQMEGGSGLFKVWRTLNSTFYTRPKLDFGFVDESSFMTSISFEIDGVDYEDSPG